MLKPLGKRVLVELIKKQKDTGLLIIPDKEENIAEAKVLASTNPEIPIGSTVLVHRTQTVVTPQGLLVHEDNVLGVLE